MHSNHLEIPSNENARFECFDIVDQLVIMVENTPDELEKQEEKEKQISKLAFLRCEFLDQLSQRCMGKKLNPDFYQSISVIFKNFSEHFYLLIDDIEKIMDSMPSKNLCSHFDIKVLGATTIGQGGTFSLSKVSNAPLIYFFALHCVPQSADNKTDQSYQFQYQISEECKLTLLFQVGHFQNEDYHRILVQKYIKQFLKINLSISAAIEWLTLNRDNLSFEYLAFNYLGIKFQAGELVYSIFKNYDLASK